MIKNNKWTRNAWQEKEIKTLENGDVQKFVVNYTHYNGCWKARWEMITEEHRDGYMSRLSIPMSDYNGQTTLSESRFNAKKLEKLEKVLANNLDKYFNLWIQEKYWDLCNELHNDFNNLK